MLLVLTARDGACKSRACAPKGSALSLQKAGLYSHCAFGFSTPMTRTHVGLLGLCFKTGRVDHRPTRRRRAPLPQRRGASRAGTGMGPSQGQPGHRGVPVHGGTVPPTRAFDSPATGRGDLLRGKYARGSPRDGGGALRSPTPRLRTSSGLNPPVRPSRFHPFSS